MWKDQKRYLRHIGQYISPGHVYIPSNRMKIQSAFFFSIKIKIIPHIRAIRILNMKRIERCETIFHTSNSQILFFFSYHDFPVYGIRVQ